MSEEWKDIPDFEGQYAVSRSGLVKALARPIEYFSPLGHPTVTMLKERILKPYYSSGYLKVDLYKNAKRKKAFVHILVAELFVPNSFNKPQVNHKDGNRANPIADNLEWTTQAGNVKHAREILKRTFNSNPPRGKLSPYSKPVLQLDERGNIIKEWGALAEIQRECGFKASHIGDCCRGKLKTMYGFYWKFKSAS